MKKVMFVLAMLSLGALCWADSGRQDATERLQNATQVMHEIMAMPDNGIPEEVLRLSHRIVVLRDRRVVADLDNDGLTVDSLLALIAEGSGDDDLDAAGLAPVAALAAAEPGDPAAPDSHPTTTDSTGDIR